MEYSIVSVNTPKRKYPGNGGSQLVLRDNAGEVLGAWAWHSAYKPEVLKVGEKITGHVRASKRQTGKNLIFPTESPEDKKA